MRVLNAAAVWSRLRMLPVALMLGLPAIGICQSTPTDKASQGVQIADTRAYVAELDRALTMARRGDYGKLKKNELKQVEQAGIDIKRLLNGHANTTDLKPEDRIAIYNAQELIVATLRSDDKNRKVCKKEATVGSRLTKTECLTVAEREARARAAKDLVEDLRRFK